MAYINELVSEEDIQRFGLDEIKRKHDPWSWRDGRPEGFIHAWTIDRERNLFFMPVKIVEEVGPSGRPEPTSKQICILSYNDALITFVLERTKCSKSFSDNPFQVAWKLLKLDMPAGIDLAKDTILLKIKAALEVYGYRGAHRHIPNTVTEFYF